MTEEQAIARATIRHANWFELDFDRKVPGLSQSHILAILEEVSDGEVTGSKANRFIGWAQSALCAEGYLSLEEARHINKQAIKEVNNA